MSAKKKPQAVETNTEEAMHAVPEGVTQLAPTPEGRVPWCPECFADNSHGPEAKVDAGGAFRVYPPDAETPCHACGKPATNVAEYLRIGSTLVARDGSKVVVAGLAPPYEANGKLSVYDVGADPGTARAVSLVNLACP